MDSQRRARLKMRARRPRSKKSYPKLCLLFPNSRPLLDAPSPAFDRVFVRRYRSAHDFWRSGRAALRFRHRPVTALSGCPFPFRYSGRMVWRVAAGDGRPRRFPTVAPGAQMRRARPPIGRKRDRNFGDLPGAVGGTVVGNQDFVPQLGRF